jgi:CRP-like cAMP-binding protein
MSHNMAEHDCFTKSYLVYGLSKEQMCSVASLATMRRLCAQDMLIGKDKHGGEVFVILKGRVKVLTDDGDQLAEVGPSGVVGEIELIDAGPRSANVICIGLVDVAAIAVADLRQLMKKDLQLGFHILANLAVVLCGRLRNADQMLDDALDHAHGGAWGNAL